MKKIVSKKKKEVTMDDLAGMVQRGFASQDKRFDILEEDVSGLKDDVSGLKDFEKRTEKALFDINSHMMTTNDRLKEIEKVLGPLLLTADLMKGNWRDHETRIARLEKNFSHK